MGSACAGPMWWVGSVTDVSLVTLDSHAVDGVAATWWDQFLLLVVQTDGAAASLDLEDTSATDVYLPLIMDSQIASLALATLVAH